MSSLDVYRRETEEILNLFLSQKITFSECVAALDAALADATRKATQRQMVSLQILIAANNEIVKKEIDRRENMVLNGMTQST
jgi:hypothetical protein